jgi:hypothetical protein
MDQVFRSKHSLFPFQLFAAIFVLFLMVGCVISPRRTLGGGGGTPTPTPSPTATPTPNPTGKLYVSNSGAGAILRFDNAFTANADASPAATITGAATTLHSPSFMTLDAAADRLYVANTGDLSVVIFDGVSTKTGTVNLAPTRFIAGPKSGLLQPTDVALDKGRDMLYVADDIDIFVFNSASSATTTGDVAFSRDISPGFAVSAIFIDAANNRLFVADQAADAVAIFDNASTLNGTVTPTRVLQGAATHLAVPSGVTVDGAGRLIVTNVGNGTTIPPTITIYANAATANGNQAPVAEITGSNTGMVTPDQIVVDKTGNGTLYNADPGAARIAIFGSLNIANGNISPTRSINGPSTGLTVGSQPVGVALDTTR